MCNGPHYTPFDSDIEILEYDPTVEFPPPYRRHQVWRIFYPKLVPYLKFSCYTTHLTATLVVNIIILWSLCDERRWQKPTVEGPVDNQVRET